MLETDAEMFGSRRVAYLSGPAPVEQFIDEMQSNSSSYFGANYMKQFISIIEDGNFVADVLTWIGKSKFDKKIGRFTICNRPLFAGSGIYYHVMMVVWHVRVLIRWWKYNPDIVIVTGNHDYWWILSPLRFKGAQIIPSYHSTLWPKLHRRKLSKVLYANLNSWLILKNAPAVVATSLDIERQIQQVSKCRLDNRIILHLPTYERVQFENFSSVKYLAQWPFTIIYTGRIEENKGIFDLLNAMEYLLHDDKTRYKLHLCGDGTQSNNLIKEIARRELSGAVVYHGYCEPVKMKEVMALAHIAVVPTQSHLEPGFEMTCCEAILCGRPLIASTACPALHYLEGASIAVTPDSASELYDAIRSVSEDRAMFQRLADRCDDLAEQFYDPENSWTHAMRQALRTARKRMVRRHAAIR